MRIGGVALLALMAASCASVDQELLDVQFPDVPDQWTADSTVGGTPTGDWVASFNDAVLRDLISEAIANNNDLGAAAANLEQARAGARITLSNQLPTIGANFGAQRSAIVTDPTTAAQAGGGTGAAQSSRLYINNFSVGGSFSWELDVWGRLTDETRASYKDATAARADLAGAQLSIAGRVAQAWFALIEARQQRELAERDTVARERNLRVTERRYDRGVSSSLDVRLSRSALGSSQANLALRQRLELEASRALEVLLGRYPAAELKAVESLPVLPPLAGAGTPLEILTRRPDLVAAEARMESAGLRSRAARKQLLPQLTLSARSGTSGPDISDLLDPRRLAGNMAAGIFQPLFQGGRLLANSKRARAAAEASLYGYVQTALIAYQEAENAIAAETLLDTREEALRLAYEEAAAAEELTERRYNSGAATIFNLLDAQTRRISAESQYIQAQQQRVSNRVQLYLAIGGDFLTQEKLAALSASVTGE
ncbi:efflux transporter outer membrane subunit [Hyphococcus flavus]|uniref:Efflux transporter outer membrane subunit n=1 Tax=Hyphococcus flavus TaxID=1866326 RepID=A0AAE9ZDC3_9PROT|nr:efflux transporter outer membrane subunit [Hyphococcus flavus]WDI30558.1 efflux transporter outer membrane subunit [Hyphococcus flavus]